MRITRFALMRKAVTNFPVRQNADLTTAKHLRRQWLHSVDFLGDRWLVRKKQERRAPGQEYYV